MILSLVFAISLTACKDGVIIDVPGPDIDYSFNYSELSPYPALRNSPSEYILVAQTDTIEGHDIESFLSRTGQNYASVIDAAKISNASLCLSENTNLSGVDSIQVKYQLAGSNQELLLVQGAVDHSNNQSLDFSELCIDKTQAFEMIKSNVVAKIYAKYDPTAIPNFQPGATCRFTAKTTLSIKLDGLLGTGL
ncbi:MAG: hypothetical protein PHS30_07940 [Bacteroidales bacterium]|nr:hypothetical protein [Bacteroidales bacterium]